MRWPRRPVAPFQTCQSYLRAPPQLTVRGFTSLLLGVTAGKGQGSGPGEGVLTSRVLGRRVTPCLACYDQAPLAHGRTLRMATLQVSEARET